MTDIGNCTLFLIPIGRRIKRGRKVAGTWWIHSWMDDHFLGVCPKFWRTLRGVLSGSRKIILAHNKLVPGWGNHVVIGGDECVRFERRE